MQNDYSGISGLTIKDIEEEKLTPFSVLIENKYVPVLPYDWMTEYGELRNIRSLKLPAIISYGFGGIVKDVGLLRDKRLIGKNVIGVTMSGSAKQLINSQFPPLLFEVPDNVLLADATALIGGADAAMHIIEGAQINSSDVVLVTGASGGVGTYVIQLLKLKGAKVVALANKNNMNFVESVGADRVLNYQKDLSLQLSKIEAPNKVIDTVGSNQLLYTICEYFDKLNIFSLSIQKFKVHKDTQKFSFFNGSIGPAGYKDLLNMLADKQIVAHIQKTFKYYDVKNAQFISKNEHSQGRILLEF